MQKPCGMEVDSTTLWPRRPSHQNPKLINKRKQPPGPDHLFCLHLQVGGGKELLNFR